MERLINLLYLEVESAWANINQSDKSSFSLPYSLSKGPESEGTRQNNDQK